MCEDGTFKYVAHDQDIVVLSGEYYEVMANIWQMILECSPT